MADTDLLLHFGHGLNLARAEEALLTLSSSPPTAGRITLDFSQCRHVDVGASWRVGNALRSLRPHCEIVVHVPVNFDPDSTFWFKFFTHSGLGFSLARYAHEIRDTSSQVITDDVRMYYATPHSKRALPIDAWASPTYLFVPDLLKGELSPGDLSVFSSRLHDSLPDNIFDARAYPQGAVTELFRLMFESTQNVWDHADKLPLEPGTHILSSLAMRYFKDITPPKALTKEFAAYLVRAKAALDTRATEGFIEIVVSDDGVGIAARQSQNSAIYHGSYQVELRSLVEAFEAGQSIKTRVDDSTQRGQPGFGFTQMIAGLRAMRAFALVRTGRALVYFDSTIEADTFISLPAPLGYLPGCALQIVFPRRLVRVWSVVDAH